LLQNSYIGMEHTENTKEKKAQGIYNPVYPRLLTLKEGAAYLGRSEYTMREMIYKRIFPVIQEGERSKLWLDVKDLDAWIDSKKKYLGE